MIGTSEQHEYEARYEGYTHPNCLAFLHAAFHNVGTFFNLRICYRHPTSARIEIKKVSLPDAVPLRAF